MRACVLWRQTTPQHFDTSRGEWEGGAEGGAESRGGDGQYRAGGGLADADADADADRCVPLQAPDLLRGFMSGSRSKGPLGLKASNQRCYSYYVVTLSHSIHPHPKSNPTKLYP